MRDKIDILERPFLFVSIFMVALYILNTHYDFAGGRYTNPPSKIFLNVVKVKVSEPELSPEQIRNNLGSNTVYEMIEKDLMDDCFMNKQNNGYPN